MPKYVRCDRQAYTVVLIINESKLPCDPQKLLFQLSEEQIMVLDNSNENNYPVETLFCGLDLKIKASISKKNISDARI